MLLQLEGPEGKEEPSEELDFQGVLSAVNLAPEQEDEETSLDTVQVENHLSRLLKKKNAGFDSLASNLSSMLSSGETDAVRLGAARLILQLHGALKDAKSAAESDGLTFNINILAKDSRSVLDIVGPR